jgi:UDP-glucose 4-epimerase
MRLLVTGGAGYIGSVVAAELLDAGHSVVVLDDLSTGHRDAVPPRAGLVEAGLRECEPVLARGFDAVLHFAAKSLVAESSARPELYWDNNVGGTLALLEAMRHTGVERLVFSSTAAVYGEPEQVPIPVDHPGRPTNPYGASKLAVDHMLTSFANAHGLAATSLRYFNVAGARGAQGERHAAETHLIPNALAAATGAGGPLTVFGRDYPTPDGTAVRDYIHVVDLADAHLRALDALSAGVHRIYNLGSGAGSSVLDVVHAVADVTGCEVPVRDAPRRVGDPAVLVADGTAAERDLGWCPSRNLHDMIADAAAFAARS